MNEANSMLVEVKTRNRTSVKHGAKVSTGAKAIGSGSVGKETYQLIPLKHLQPSPTNPRRKIDEKTIESLAASIRTQGVLEPLIVRKIDKGYEIVCGERRYRAVKLAAEVSKVPCLVRTLTDEQVLDIQIHENLHREDIYPMEEAQGYKFLQEKLGCDIRELALRVGKPEGYVLNRLKLNQLIKEAQQDLDEELLPLTYALEIAKYDPEIQTVLYERVYRTENRFEEGEYVQVALKGQMVPLKAFVEWINNNVHRRLSLAPFDPKATNLRSDGLPCTKCPERTGAALSLFEQNQTGKKDACLNPACYTQKLGRLVDVRRQELAESGKVDPTDVPIIRSSHYSNGEDYLGNESMRVIAGKDGKKLKNCKHLTNAVDIEDDNYGQVVQVCLKASGCKTHWPVSQVFPSEGPSNEKSAEETATEQLEIHRARREEIWNAKVAEAVRIRVFQEAAERFEKKFRLTEVGTDFLPQLVDRFWRMSASGDSGNLNKVVKDLLAGWVDKSADGNEVSATNHVITAGSLKTLKRGVLFRVLFLLVHGHKGTIGYGNNYTSQKEVQKLAGEFNVNYALIDAEVRLDLCAKKYKQVHEIYLDAVRGKKEATIPGLFSEKWKAQD